MELNGEQLAMLAWAVSALVRFDARAMSPEVRQLCYALAERASQPEVVSGVDWSQPCRTWAAILHGLSTVGVSCAGNNRVQRAFSYAVEDELPRILKEGRAIDDGRCGPRDIVEIAQACVSAEFKGNMKPFISAVADRMQGPNSVMYGAEVEQWSALVDACVELAGSPQALVPALGEDVLVILREGAADISHATMMRAHPI